jgi:septal ring factor EnvC (AmiA/AmiB activator)
MILKAIRDWAEKQRTLVEQVAKQQAALDHRMESLEYQITALRSHVRCNYESVASLNAEMALLQAQIDALSDQALREQTHSIAISGAACRAETHGLAAYDISAATYRYLVAVRDGVPEDEEAEYLAVLKDTVKRWEAGSKLQ